MVLNHMQVSYRREAGWLNEQLRANRNRRDLRSIFPVFSYGFLTCEGSGSNQSKSSGTSRSLEHKNDYRTQKNFPTSRPYILILINIPLYPHIERAFLGFRG